MLFILIILITVSHLNAQERKYPIKPSDSGLTPIEMIQNHGYPAEIHKFTSEDGYNLEYHRVPHGFGNRDLGKNRPAIILMNGLSSSSAIEFAQGPKKGFGYILADAGYDVWVSNYRGNHISLSHVKLDRVRDEKEFYDFSFHEIGYYDIPAAIDYISNVTGNKDVFFYGNSLGSSAFLAFGASRPDFVKKIKLAVLASPSAYVKRSDYLDYLLKRYFKFLQNMFHTEKLWKLHGLPIRKAWKELSSPFFTNITAPLLAIAIMSEEDAEALKPYYGAYLFNMPSGAPMKHLEHYGQLILSEKFQEYDYGEKENLKRYGTPTPRQYNISNVVCPIAVFFAKHDIFIPYDQQVRLKSEIPNLVYEYEESTGRYNHMSFVAAADLPDRIWKRVIKVLDKYR